MKKHLLLLISFSSLVLFSCNTRKSEAPSSQNPLVFHFELDADGNIKNEEVKKQLTTLAKKLSHDADRVMLTAYSEQTGDKAKNRELAFEMADAAKKFMSAYDERAYFNIGVTIKGYDNPVNASNPADIENRRIEFSYLPQ